MCLASTRFITQSGSMHEKKSLFRFHFEFFSLDALKAPSYFPFNQNNQDLDNFLPLKTQKGPFYSLFAPYTLSLEPPRDENL